MRILHISRFCYLFSIGGTEKFQEQVLKLSRKNGINAELMVLKDTAEGISLLDEDLRIWSCYRDESTDMFPWLFPREEKTIECFERYIAEEGKPDVLCFHTFGQAECAIAKVAKIMNIPYSLVYHAPAWSCITGRLLKWNNQRCNGKISLFACGRCFLQHRYKLPLIGYILLLPLIYSCNYIFPWMPKRLSMITTLWKKLSRRKQILTEFFRGAASFIAFSSHGDSVFLQNGGESSRLRRLAQGVGVDFEEALDKYLCENKDRKLRNGKLKISIIGRCSKEKGIHIVLKAFEFLKDLDAELHILGVDKSKPYADELLKIAGNDNRVYFHELVPYDEVISYYCQTDILAIPSIWYETGPITLFEGLAAGCTVMGSGMIGQIETLRKHGIVVDPNTPEAWITALQEAIPGALQRRTAPFPENIRNFQTVTDELNQILREHINHE